LREHFGAAVAFMKISKNYPDFVDMMDQHYPRFGGQYRFAVPLRAGSGRRQSM
jgi:hypothetical protein